MQAYTEIPDTQTLQASRSLLLDNDKTIMSCFSGTAFPTNGLQLGMLCYRTDQNKLYQLTALTPTWTLVRDLAATAWDSSNFTPTNYAALAGATFTGKVNVPASATGGAGIRAPHGVAPSAPVDGDLWTTTTGIFVRINGSTIQLANAANAGVASFNTRTGAVTLTSGDVTGALGFTPVQQGGGTGQGTNKVYIGWNAGGLKAQVDTTDLGTLWYSSNFNPANYAALTGADFTGKARGSAVGNFAASPAYGLETYATSGAATMAFHRGGAYAIVAGLDTDNVFKIGGWSDGANVFRMLVATNYVQFNNDLILRGSAPTMSFRDTDGRSGFIHVNGNVFYVLRGAVDGATWDGGPNGRHPMTLNLDTGNVEFSGDGGFLSDIRTKRDLSVVQNALIRLDAMRGYTYVRNDTGEPGIGVVAQEVQAAFPEAVREGSDGMLSVNYNGLVAPLIEAIRELHARVKVLEANAAAI